MTDIVENLRSQIGDDVSQMYSHEALFRIASDEITRLRADVARLREGVERASIQISGGLTYATAEAKHAQLRDAAKTLAALNTRGEG